MIASCSSVSRLRKRPPAGSSFRTLRRKSPRRARSLPSAQAGATRRLIPIDLKAGDRVLFGKWSGTEVKIDGVDYLVMKETDVMGVLTETDARRKAA